MTDHPITPPPELLMEWSTIWHEAEAKHVSHVEFVAIQAARWGDDQRLEACCEWVSRWCGRWPDGTRPEDELRAAMRPKPPSLKEQALNQLAALEKDGVLDYNTADAISTIRRALEALDDN